MAHAIVIADGRKGYVIYLEGTAIAFEGPATYTYGSTWLTATLS